MWTEQREFTLWNDSPFAIRLHSGVSGLKLFGDENHEQKYLISQLGWFHQLHQPDCNAMSAAKKSTLKVIEETYCPIGFLHYSALRRTIIKLLPDDILYVTWAGYKAGSGQVWTSGVFTLLKQCQCDCNTRTATENWTFVMAGWSEEPCHAWSEFFFNKGDMKLVKFVVGTAG